MSIVLNGSTGITTPDGTSGSYNQGQLAGFRNKILNGSFAVNQRGYTSGLATTAGQYTVDRWKVTGTGGITYATVNNKTTVTIPAGQTLQQVIAGINLDSGTYILTWEGTAQGRVGSGAYGNSGQVTANITGGVNTTIEFNAGTVTNVQLEPGVIATPFEWRGGPLEERERCHPYFWNSPQLYVFQFACPASGGFSHVYTIKYPLRMRVTPTLSTNFQGAYNVASTSIVTTGTEAFQVQVVGTSGGNSGITLQGVTATAEL